MADSKRKVEFACQVETLCEESGTYLPTGHIIMGYGLGGNEGKHGVYFKPHEHASDKSLRNFFGVKQTGRKTVELSKALPSVSDILPTHGTFIHNKLAHLINGFGSRNDSERLKALVKHEHVIEKYGMRITDVTPGKENIRDKNLSRGIEKAKEEVLEGEREILKAIANYPGIFTNQDVAPGGPLEKNKEYTSFIVKTCGSSHLVFDDPQDPTKLIKAIKQADESVKNSLINFEVMANKVVRGAGMKAPEADVAILDDNGARAIRMSNFAVRNGVQECRRQSFMSFLGKQPDEIHQMTYDEMAGGLDLYEKQLPQELQNPELLRQNKIAIAQWAMVNSSLNNTDNHGRNLEVLKDSEGRVEISPFYDVTFDSNERPMSTAIGGIPPIHKIDITNDQELQNLCEHLGIEDSIEEVLASRDQLMESMTNIPEYAEQLGMDMFGPEIEHVISAVSKQSNGLKAAVEMAIEEARNQKVNELQRIRENSSGMEASF